MILSLAARKCSDTILIHRAVPDCARCSGSFVPISARYPSFPLPEEPATHNSSIKTQSQFQTNVQIWLSSYRVFPFIRCGILGISLVDTIIHAIQHQIRREPLRKPLYFARGQAARDIATRKATQFSRAVRQLLHYVYATGRLTVPILTVIGKAFR